MTRAAKGRKARLTERAAFITFITDELEWSYFEAAAQWDGKGWFREGWRAAIRYQKSMQRNRRGK